MQEIEFNLLTEPWVRVRLPDNTVQEVSLTDALVHAQEYMDLTGEMPSGALGSTVGAETFPGAAHPGLSGAVERPLLALPSGAAILAGAGGKNWKPI